VTVTTALPPAGWYADPWRASNWRWWDGTAWTGYTDRYYPPVTPTFPVAAPDETRPIQAGWIAILGIVTGLALSVAVYVVGFAFGVARGNPLLLLAAQLGLWTGMVGACAIAVRRHGTGSLRDLGLRIRGVDLPLGLGYGIASRIGIGIIAAALIELGISPHQSSIVGKVDRGALAVVVLLFVTVIGAPFVEELFFRGLLMSGLIVRFGVTLGVILQAMVFGLVHLTPTDAGSNVGVFLLIAPVGVVLGLLRLGYKRLGTGMVTHAVFNAIAVTVLLTR
jgi:membrane protease YdiL (CAAX protease family)